ncbi:MAG: bifunctional diguanylate cyclase/phosphodiesterase [Sphaerochaeta sp.]|nr:bifunctional diguanylate cyclase/phosphodiesterase [Sphaerochaeta sp.]
MIYSSHNTSVGFFCLDDGPWTITEGIEDLLAFLDCPADVFAQTYHSSLKNLMTQPKTSLLPLTQRVRLYGLSCLCSAEMQKGRWSVRLDRLPFGLQGKEQEVGHFRLGEGTRLKWADESFYKILGFSEEEFSSSYGGDLCRFDASLSSLPVRLYQHVAKQNLLFCTGGRAGYCFPLSPSSTLNTYHKALQTSGIRVWQYDVVKRTLEGVTFCDADLVQLESLHRRLREGESTVSSQFFLEGERRYVSVHYQREGSIAFAVEQDMTSFANRQRFTFFDEHLNEQSMHNIVRADLTDNQVVYLRKNGKPDKGGGSFSEVFESLISSFTSDDERQTFRQRFNLEALLEAEQKEVNELRMEYRTSDETGSIHWMEARVLLNRDVHTHHIHALGTSRRITGKKKLELSLTEKPHRDPVTSFYDRKTFSSMVGLALKSEDDRSLGYALAIIEVPGIFGFREKLVSHMAQIILLGINDRCFVGRLDAVRFGMFFETIASSLDIKVRLERLASMLSTSSAFDVSKENLSLFSGFTTGLYSEDSSYQAVFDRAVMTLEKARERGNNQVCAHEEGLGSGLAPMMPPNVLDIRAQGVVLGCMDATIRGEDLGSTLPLILSQVGMYYQGRRVCLLSQEQGKALVVAASWEPAASSRSFAQFPYDPFFGLFDKQPVRKFMASDTFASFPCLDGSALLVGSLQVWNLSKCYLVVLDPLSDDLSVLAHAVQLISSEMTKRRLLDRQEYLLYHDRDTGLKNFHGYNQYVSTLQEDALSSLALVMVDINDLKEVNRHHGKEFGNTIIRTITQLLGECFSKATLFRISSHEFLGIRADITYKAFRAKVERLTSQLDRMLPGTTTVAQAWSDQEKHISVLYNQATMELEANRKNSLAFSSLGEHYQLYEELQASLGRGEYLIYLQPKIWCATEKVSGSEALIRHMHPTHGLVSPAKFIPKFEQDGLIKHIDLFVFEEVCKLLKRWQAEELPPTPVSLNFSRLTLLDANLISKMEEIRARHGVDSMLVEIEITESFGSLDRNLVKKVVEQIVGAGFPVCIDDFGSEYSNLSTLTSLPLRVLKLDKSLIDSLTTSAKAQAFVEGFIAICKKLEIQTVAEGVETEGQKSLLSSMGCDMVQGYLFDKPLAVKQFEQKYRAWEG